MNAGSIQLAAFLFFAEPPQSWHMHLSPKWCTHCFVLTYDGDCWIAHELDSHNLKFKRIRWKDGEDIVNWLSMFQALNKTLSAFIVVELTEQAKLVKRLLPTRWFFTCNEVARELSGIDIGFTFNPVHLYAKLIKYDAKRNYKILWHRRIEDGITYTPSKSSG